MSARNTSFLIAMCVVLAIAVLTDLRRHRIPNTLTLAGLLCALSLQLITSGLAGLGAGVLGALVGTACFLPFWLLRGMGAGDVKLLAAVGAFLGPHGAFYAAMFSLIAGGLTAIGYVMWCAARASMNTLRAEGFGAAGISAFLAAQLARRDRFAFAVPIAIGALAAGWNSYGDSFASSLQQRWFT